MNTLIAHVGARLQAVDDVCPVAPPGVEVWTNEILGWVKWGVLALIGICFFVSVGLLVWGRVSHHPRGAKLGFDGILVCLAAAILFVVGYVIISSITGDGC